MKSISRRAALGGVLATGAALTAGVPAMAQPAAAPVVVTPENPRYADLVVGDNQRWVGTPDRIIVARTATDVVAAVGDAVRTGTRIAVRSGGHCYEDFVANPDVRLLVDLSQLDAVGYDPAHRAFSIGVGARLLPVYEALYTGWGVTIPGGSCYSVGVGGHIAGGGYGLLSRKFGLTVDHLYGVEVVVAGPGGVRTVVATREHNPDLWWAHTGGGGGNFGVVTRYLMRTPGTENQPPERQLPIPSGRVRVASIGIPWSALDQRTFSTLVSNFCTWHERNSTPGSPANALSATFALLSRPAGQIGLSVQVDAAAGTIFDDFLTALCDNSGITPTVESRELPWLHATRYLGTNTPFLTDSTARAKHKAAYHRRAFTDDQLATIYRNLSEPSVTNPDAMLILLSFGGEVNAVKSDATAVSQRDSVFKALYQTFWHDPNDDNANLAWVRNFYQQVYANTGGVPVPNRNTDGCYINYPDTDLSNPELNKSGIPWHDLYYQQNYPRLQAVKQQWDPSNIFHHKQSIELPKR